MQLALPGERGQQVTRRLIVERSRWRWVVRDHVSAPNTRCLLASASFVGNPLVRASAQRVPGSSFYGNVV